MSVSPSEFLTSAKLLLVDSSEMATRNAVSRAYYAAFHQAQRSFPVDKAFAKKSSTGMHEAYIDQLMQAAPGSVERVTAVKLNALKGRRAKADYRLADDIQPFVASMQIQTVEELFDLLSQLPGGVMQSQEPTSVEEDDASAEVSLSCSSRPKLERIR